MTSGEYLRARGWYWNSQYGQAWCHDTTKERMRQEDEAVAIQVKRDEDCAEFAAKHSTKSCVAFD
jgi:hypothetical protein